MPPSNTIDVGGYVLTLPDFWQESGEVRERPGFFGYNAVATGGVSFDLSVILGRSQDVEERKLLVNAMLEGYAPERHQVTQETFRGTALERHRMEGLKGFPPGAVYELFLCDAYEDLLAFGFSYTAPLPQEEALRNLFQFMVYAAIVKNAPAP